MNIPQNLEAEMRILANAMISVDWVNDLFSKAKAEYFHSPKTLAIYSTMKRLYELDRDITFETVSANLPPRILSNEELAQVFVLSCDGLFIQDFLDILKQCYLKRMLLKLAEDIISILHSGRDPKEIIEFIEGTIFSLDDDNVKNPGVHISDFLKDGSFLKKIEQRQQNFLEGKCSFEGMPTHYYDLDTLIRGLTPGHLTIVGARPGMGKTTLALNLIEQLCFKSNGRCLFFSLEMPKKEVVEKLLCQTSEIEFEKVSKGTITGPEYQKLVQAYHAWNSKALIIDDQPGLSIDTIKSRCIRSKRAHNINAIFIDYVQLISAKGHEARHLEIGHISRKLKEIAKELEVPIVALAQLNRLSEGRTDKRPFVSDLRESGSLEADADEVILIHRPECYDAYDKPGIMELNVAKNRFGATGQVKLLFEKKYGALKSYQHYTPRQSEVALPPSEEKDSSGYFY